MTQTFFTDFSVNWLSGGSRGESFGVCFPRIHSFRMRHSSFNWLIWFIFRDGRDFGSYPRWRYQAYSTGMCQLQVRPTSSPTYVCVTLTFEIQTQKDQMLWWTPYLSSLSSQSCRLYLWAICHDCRRCKSDAACGADPSSWEQCPPCLRSTTYVP
jgi:hypothetical protein